MTPRQRDCFIAIIRGRQATGCSPTYDALRVTLGLRSKSGIHRLIKGLEERGHLVIVRLGYEGIDLIPVIHVQAVRAAA